jgi:hypothetical protein
MSNRPSSAAPLSTRSATPDRLPEARAGSGGSLLGVGLMALGAVVAVLGVLWLGANAATGVMTVTGVIFSLMFVALFSLPLVGVGWYLRGRGRVEALEAQTFTARHEVLDSDRLVRRELTRELNQRIAGMSRLAVGLPPEPAQLLARAAARLRDLADDVARPGYDAAAWLERTAARLDQAALANVGRYDELVLAEARQLGDLERRLADDPRAAEQIASLTDLLATHVQERDALLGRGREAPALAPQELLAAAARPRRALETPLALSLDDAVSYEGEDYLVRGILTYFAGGRSWKAYQLHDGKQERWLEVRGGGADLGWLEPATVSAAPEDETVTLNGVPFASQESGSTSVEVVTAAGRREGVFVQYRRYTTPSGAMLVVERWPDGVRALMGTTAARENLQLWTRPPAAE